jgi:hypothetical protein
VGPNADVDTFLTRLTQYVHGLGFMLVTRSTNTTFFIPMSDALERRGYCNAMLDDPTHIKVDDMIFVDGTQL